MAPRPIQEKYPVALRILHWLMAILIIGLLALGLAMTHLPKGDANHSLLVGLHKSFGITVLALAFARLGIRLGAKAPPLPRIIPVHERSLARASHWVLYFFMFLLPVTGYVMSTSYGLSVRWFGLALPKLVSVDKARGELAWDIHSWGAYVLIFLLAMHIGAVGFHFLRQRLNLLPRIV